MYKPKPAPFIPSQFNKPYIRQRDVNPDFVKGIFSIMQEGDLNKIQNYIVQKNISPKVTDDLGNTLIHIVLTNEAPSFKENARREIIDYLILNGASVSAQNKDNITALHLASKMQYPTIVKLLIENGADVKAIDNHEMTPLHYATQGKITDCVKTRKVGSLIPKSSIKYRQEQIIKDMVIDIIDILYTKNFSQYLKHIKNNLNKIDEILPAEFKKEESMFMNSIATIVNDKLKSDVEKQLLIKTKISEYVNTCTNLAKSKLTKSLDNLDIRLDQKDGWGPKTSEIKFKDFSRILGKDTPQSLIDQMRNTMNQEIQEVSRDLNNHMPIVKNNAEINRSTIDKIFYKLNKIQQLNKSMEINTTQDKTTPSNLAHPVVAEDIEYYYVEISTLRSLYLYRNKNHFEFPDVNMSGLVDIPPKNNEYFCPKLQKQVETIRGSKEQKEKWIKNKEYPTEYILLDEKQYVIIGSHPENSPYIKQSQIISPAPPYNVRPRSSDPPGPYDGESYYYISKLKFNIIQINRNYDLIEKNEKALVNHLNKNYLYHIINDIIPNIVISTYNIYQNMRMAFSEQSYINDVNNNLLNAFTGKKNESINHPYNYLMEQCVDEIEEIKDQISEIYKTFNILYDNLKELTNKLNKVIAIVNKISGIKFAQNFMGQSFESPEINSYENIFDRLIYPIAAPPNNMTAYNDKFKPGIDLETIRKIIYEDYIPYIDINTYASYYTESKIPSLFSFYYSSEMILLPKIYPSKKVIKAQSGYLAPAPYKTIKVEPNIVGLEPTLLPENVTLKNKGYGLYLDKNQNNIPYHSSTIPIPDKIILNHSNETKIGNYGLVNEKMHKSKMDPNITIGNYLNEYTNIIKISLVQAVISIFNDPNTQSKDIYTKSGATGATGAIGAIGATGATGAIGATGVSGPLLTSLKVSERTIQLRDEFLKSIKDKYPVQDHAETILFTTVGKLCDELIINHIKNSIHGGVNKYITKLLKGQDVKFNQEYSDLLQNQIILKTDTGFELNFNKMIDELLEIFETSQAQTNTYDALINTQTIMEENIDIAKDQYYIYDKNYRIFNEVIDQKCYRINPKIATLLINANAPVNVKDRIGKTPLSYAIDTQHVELIKKLLTNNALVTRLNTSNTNITPYNYIISLVDEHNQILITDNQDSVKNILDKFCTPLYEKIKTNILSNIDYKNNIMRYMNIVFPMLIIMINNMFYMQTRAYVNGWTLDDHMKLKKIFLKYGALDNNSLDNLKIPLIDIDTSDLNFVGKFGKDLDILYRRIASNVDVLNKNQTKIDKINRKIDDIKHEINQLSLPTDPVTNAYITSLNEDIAQLISERDQLVNIDKKAFEDKNNNILSNIEPKESRIITNLKTRIDSFVQHRKHFSEREPKKLYDNIFNYVIQDAGLPTGAAGTTDPDIEITGFEDFLLYNKLWDILINDVANVPDVPHKLSSIYNLHLNLPKVIHGIIPRLKSNNKNELDDTKKDIEVLKELYNKILTPLMEDLNTLPQNYNENDNYVMVKIIDCIVHIVGNVLCSNMYYAVLKTITTYIKSINPKEVQYKDKLNNPQTAILDVYKNDRKTYNKYIRQIINRIVDNDYKIPPAKTKNASLKKYIINEIPLPITKLLLRIYSDDIDAHKDIDSLDTIFENIINIIISNNIIPITQDSSLVMNLKTYVFRYYKDVFTQVIPSMKILVNNYSRYILNEGRLINILYEMVNQACNEMQ